MGHTTEYLIEIENIKKIIFDIALLIEKIKVDNLTSNEKSKLKLFNRFLKLLVIELSPSEEEYDFKLLHFINAYIVPLKIDIDIFLNQTESDFPINALINRFDKVVDMYSSNKNDILNSNRTNKATNSESYYNAKIAEFKAKEAELREELKKVEGKSQEEINKINLELEEANRKQFEYKNELEIKKKNDDEKEYWKININKAFEDLKTYLKPIKDEQYRLNVLFWVYLIMSVLLVIAVIVIECIAVNKIISETNFPDFKQYITIYLPLPVAGALLWGFIYQMNRAQRQLVVVAKSIHNVEYIQGLLLTINKLAPTFEDGRSRINIAIDKLISNHLGQKEIDTEECLMKEEGKDSLPYDTVIKLLKDIKGLTKKE